MVQTPRLPVAVGSGPLSLSLFLSTPPPPSSPSQKLLGRPMAVFQIIPLTLWHEGEIEELEPPEFGAPLKA